MSSRKPPCQDALAVAVVSCTSAIHALLAFSIAHEWAHNLLLKHVLPFCSSQWSHKWPQNYFPLFAQDLCQHARVACGARRFQNGNSITRLKATSPRSLDAPSVLISVRVSIKPSWSPLHCSRSTSRDFVPWRFSYACRRRARIGSSCTRPKTSTIADVSRCSIFRSQLEQ